MQGGGVASGGMRDMIPTIARTAVVCGVDGIFMEVNSLPFLWLNPQGTLHLRFQ